MRDFIFILILVSMAGLSAWHVSSSSWFALSIDIFIAFNALRIWNPRKIRRR